jgi:glucose-1-phosphate thymidylyltransferase
MIGCPEEVAYRMNFISREKLRDLACALGQNSYASYLVRLVEEE